MKLTLITLFTLFSICAGAIEQKDFSIPSDCKSAIEAAVIDQIGNGDETFSVVAIKLVYGGVYKGLSYPVVAIVRTSDEVDPRDVLVKTSIPQNGTCVAEFVEILADASLIEDPSLNR